MIEYAIVDSCLIGNSMFFTVTRAPPKPYAAYAVAIGMLLFVERDEDNSSVLIAKNEMIALMIR